MASGEGFHGTGRFLIQRRLGAGGMGTVYLAYDVERQSTVALKTLNRLDPTSLYRFKAEFRSLAAFTHPNLISLHELLAVDDVWFFTMEFVEGLNFLDYARHGFGEQRAAVAASSEMAHDRLRHALVQLIEGASVLHKAGYVHCDIKPSNVLVTRAGQVKLLDFGLIREFATGEEPQHPPTFLEILGTPAFMSPEQASGVGLSPASDWYSVGIMVYQALTGQLPFVKGRAKHANPGQPANSQYRGGVAVESGTPSPENWIDVVVSKQTQTPPSPRTLLPDIPEDLDEIAAGLLRPQPELRFTRAELLDRLRRRTTTLDDSELLPASTAASTIFVGREDALLSLNQAFVESTSAATVVCIEGQSGIGKTSLVRHFLDRLDPETHPIILSGRCYDQESVPYKAFDSVVDALSDYLRNVPYFESMKLMPRDMKILERLFPVLGRVRAVAHMIERAVPDAQERRQRAFAAFRELIGHLASRAPVVLTIDDLHWGDLESVPLVEELLRPPDAPRILLIFCYRSEEVERNAILNRLTQTLRTIPNRVSRITLGPLSSAETTALASTLLEESNAAPSMRAHTVVRESGGHPYLARELVHHLKMSGTSRTENTLTLDDALARRLEHLPESALRLLQIVAISGQPIQHAIANTAAGLQAGDRTAASILRSLYLLRAVGSPTASIELYQDRIRNVVLQHIPIDLGRNYHLQLGLALERAGGADPETLAAHFDAAEDFQKAGTYAEAAGDQAAAALAFERAARLYRRSLELRKLGSDDKRSVLVRLADSLSNAGRGSDAATAYLQASEDASPQDRLEWRRRAAQQLLISGHIDDGLALMRVVLSEVGLSLAKTPYRALLSLMVERAKLRFRGLRFVESTDQKPGSQQLTVVDICWSVAVGLALVDFIQSIAFQSKHLRYALEAGEPHRIARGLAMEAGFMSARGQSAVRRRHVADLAVTLARRLESQSALGLCSLTSGVTEFYEGNWDQALELEETAERLLLDHCTGVHWELQSARLYQIMALFYLGRIRTLRSRVNSFLIEAHDRGNLYAGTTFRTGLANVAWLATDDLAGARQAISEAVDQWSHTGFHIQHYLAMLSQGQLALYEGAGERGWKDLTRSWPDLSASQLLRVEGIRVVMLHLRARCALAAAIASPGDRRDLIAAAQRDARRIEREQWAWRGPLVKLLHAAVANLKGDRDAAAALVKDAASGFERVKMGLYAAAARRRLGELTQDAGIVTLADDWMRSEDIAAPERMTRMLAPALDLHFS